MASKSIPIENQDFPQDNFAQDSFDESIQESFDEVTQELENDFNQDQFMTILHSLKHLK
jgi:hypothetical protein